jgi:hypothetical protein
MGVNHKDIQRVEVQLDQDVVNIFQEELSHDFVHQFLG